MVCEEWKKMMKNCEWNQMHKFVTKLQQNGRIRLIRTRILIWNTRSRSLWRAICIYADVFVRNDKVAWCITFDEFGTRVSRDFRTIQPRGSTHYALLHSTFISSFFSQPLLSFQLQNSSNYFNSISLTQNTYLHFFIC